MNLSPEVKAAFEEVRKYHPEVTQVFIAKNGWWTFYDEELNVPRFAPTFDVGPLEAMVNSLERLPAAFAYPDEHQEA